MNFKPSWVKLFGDDSPGASIVRVNQVLELAKSAPSMALGNIVNAGLTAGVYYNSAPLPLLGGWVAIVWLLSAARLRSWWRNRRRPPPSSISRRPLVRSVIWSAVAGAMWGAMGFVLLQYEGLPLQVLVVFVVGGQAAAAAIWIAPLPAASLAYILPSMLPVIAGIAVKGDSLHLAMAGMLATYTAVLMLFSRNTHRNFINAIRSDFERERLVVQLETAHAQLEERVRQRTAELSGTNRRLEKEIEERQEVEAELRGNQQLLQTIIDAVPLRISVTDKQGKKLLANKTQWNYWGLPDDAGLPRAGVYPHMNETESAIVHKYERLVLEQGQTFEYERERTLKDGTIEWVQASWVPLRSAEGEITGVLLVASDITQRKQEAAEMRESRDQLRLITDNLPVLISYVDSEQRFRFGNKFFLDWYNLPNEKVVGYRADEILSPASFKKILPKIEAVLAGEQVTFEEAVDYPDGQQRNVEIKYIPHIGNDGKVQGWVSMATDISERLKAEIELRESRDQLRKSQRLQQSVFDAIPVPVWFKDPAGTYQMVNNALCELYNLAPEQILGKSTAEIRQLPRETIARTESEDNKALETRQPVQLTDERLELPNGDVLWQNIIRAPLIDEFDNVAGLVGVAQDTTERVLAEEAAARREEQLRAVIENIPAAVLFKDTQGRILLVNKVFEQWCDLPAENIVGKTSKDLFDRDTAEKFMHHDDQVLVDQSIISDEYFLTYPDGEHRTVLIYKFPVFDDGGTLMGVGAVTLDQTERRKAEEELRLSESRYHTLASSVPVGIFQTDAQGRALYVNERWSEITGLSPAQAFGDGWAQSIHPEDREEVLRIWSEAVDAGAPFLHEYRFLRPDGEVTRVLGRAVADMGDARQIIGYIGSITDITDRTRLEEQLRQAQKMEAVGQLAGGVAHDFNNMLQIVISYVHIARTALDKPENLTRYLDNICKGADRAANLTRQLLTFSRKDMLQPTVVDINDLISNLMKMLERLLGENIEMSLLPGGGLNSASADPGMLEQVLVNLSVNARDAMPEGGRLVLETSDFHADEEFCKIHVWIKPGNYVRISVSDTGMGMTQEVQEHIFEPFFSTKEAGKGTGLGLSMVYSIIEQHNGIINVYSEVGVGTSFQIYLPAIAGAMHRLETQDAQPVPGGEETILVAEDEASVRELLCELLEGQGYRVLLARDGEQAVSKYHSRKEPIDLVIMDVVMPKISGRTAYDQIRAIDPHVPIVFSTGYAANTMDKEFLAQDGLRIIHKPYTPGVLFQTIREVIDQAAAAASPQPA